MNNPRITGYALGELDPAAREAFEHELATSTDLQRELKETIALIEALPIAITMNETLSDTERQTLRTRASENLQVTRHAQTGRRRLFTAGIGALAAGLAMTAIVISQNHKPSVRAVVAAAPTQKVIPPASPAAAPASSSSPAASPVKIDLQTRLLAEADGFYTRGSYDLAAKRYQQVLNTDPFNLSARKGMETVNEARQKYYHEAYNDTRASLLWQAENGWKHPVRRFSSGKDMSLGQASDKTGAPAGVDGTVPESHIEARVATAVPSGQFPRSPVTLRFNYGQQSASYVVGGAKKANASADLRSGNSGDFNTEAYDSVTGNAFLGTQENPLSTLSIDVDTASYANVRRFLTGGQLPPAGAVRIEELINYFPYTYPQPEGGTPFSVTTDVTRAPWNEKHLLARIALKGRDLATDKLPASNLVFLVDVSGSMDEPNKLPLLKRSLAALVEKLSARDHVAIVVYAGSSGTALPSTPGEDKARILEAIERLEAGGSTNGAEGIRLAYDIARKQFLEEGNNRVILCTDGDFNVGVTSRSELVRLIESERKSGVFLSVLGFGTGNVKDSQMEQLADKGNGNYAYIDTPSEGRKVLVEQMGATLFTIAKDVKIQVEFNPSTVAGYRLIGYENRLLAKEDFNDDTKDAGEIGAGHTVTALYEIVPRGQPLPGTPKVDPLKYQQPPIQTRNPSRPDLFAVKLRYKAPDSDTSKLIEKIAGPGVEEFAQAPADFRFASAVAAFGMKLRADRNDSFMDWSAIQKIARGSLGEDPGTYRAEFLTLVEKARQLAGEEK